MGLCCGNGSSSWFTDLTEQVARDYEVLIEG
jgi:hypothetical protein